MTELKYGNLQKYDMNEKMNRYHWHRFTIPTDFYVFLEATINNAKNRKD